MARIEATAEFGRAPVMRRLLRFLVETTLSGRGSQLKAYSVAVDGLGRSPDFDAQSDSYPRVQVGRLRRMLQAFYAQHGPQGELRLSIPAGAYLVEFSCDPVLGEIEPSEPVVPEPRHLRLRPWVLGGAIGVVLALLIGAAVLWKLLGGQDDTPRRPADNLAQPPTMIVEIKSMQNARSGLAQATDAFLVDAIRRSRLIRLRQPDVEAASQAQRGDADYRLTGAISGGAQPDLFVRLWRTDLDRLIWSGVVRLPADGAGLEASLLPMLVELGQPYGVIASDQRARHAHDFAPGYPCYLQFDLYRRDPEQVGAAEVGRCMDATLRTDPHQATALAAKALLLIEQAQAAAGGPDKALLQRAASLAGRATAVDPYSADAHFAASQSALLQGSCGRARESGRRALNLDPYNPDLMARIGRDLAFCGDDRGEKLLRHAIALDPNPPASFFTPLVLAALGRNDLPGAKEIADRMTPPGDSAGSYAFTMALVQAAAGDAEAARTSWATATGAADSRADPQNAIKRWHLAPNEEQLALGLLAKAGVTGPDPAAATIGSNAAASANSAG